MSRDEAAALDRYCRACEDLLAAWEALPDAVRSALVRPSVILPPREDAGEVGA